MGFYIFISILILIVCILLGLIVLIQSPKGGGLASTFGGQGNQFMGVRRTADFLEKGTWILAITLLFLSLVSVYVIPSSIDAGGASSTELSVDGSQMSLPTQLPGITPIEDVVTTEVVENAEAENAEAESAE